MGRHPIGFEVQKVLAAVDRFPLTPRPPRRSASSGMPKADWCFLCGRDRHAYRRRARERLFRSARARVGEPIDRNVWSLLERFSDAEIAALVLPRHLVIEHAEVPSFTSSKGAWQTPSGTSVRAEFDRIPVVPAFPRPSRRRRRRSPGRRDLHKSARRFCQTPGLHADGASGGHAHRPAEGIRSGGATPGPWSKWSVRSGIGARGRSMSAIGPSCFRSCPN